MRSSFSRLARCFSLAFLLVLAGRAAVRAQIPTSGGPRPAPAAPLPVDLLGITARNAGVRNLVEWTVANEQALAAYGVEHSADGLAFERLAEVAAAGKSGYSVYDNAPNPGLTYYRLILINRDGSAAYSKTVQAVMGTTGAVVVTAMPNPVQQELRIVVSGAQNGQVRLSDIGGRTVATGTVANGEARVQTGDLAAGPYILQFSNGNVSKTIKVTKQ